MLSSAAAGRARSPWIEIVESVSPFRTVATIVVPVRTRISGPGTIINELDLARRFGVAVSRFHLQDASEGIAGAASPARAAEPISVDVRRLAFFEQPPFDLRAPMLACAFHDADVEYVWERARAG